MAAGDSDKNSEEAVAEVCAALASCVEVSDGCMAEDCVDRLGVACRGDGATS